MINLMLKSVLEQDRSPVVICDLEHKIVFMNKAATVHYTRWGGEELIGKSLLGCHNKRSCEMIEKIIEWFAESRENNMIYTYRSDSQNKDVYMVALRDGDGALIGYYEKHEYRNTETSELYDFTKSLI